MAKNRSGALRTALEESVEALALPREYQVWIEAARVLADSLDDVPDDKLWREFRLVLSELFGRSEVEEGVTDGLIEEIRRAAVSDG